MQEFMTLEAESLQTVYGAFMEAFSDYSVPVTWSFEEFRASCLRRGVDLSISLGVREDGRLVGFVMNGRGTWGGVPAAYDAGTGVVPAARGSGLAGRMASRALDLLAALGIRRYVLEVIRDNLPAFRTYVKAGFEVTRSLECPGGVFTDPGKPAPVGLTVEESGREGLDGKAAAARRDWEPSWQNSDDSVRRAVEPLVVLEASLEGSSAGHLVASPSGTIWQLAVDRDLRRRGIGTALLRTLASRRGPSIRYVNVQAGDGATLGLLESCGIGPGVGQYEMIREL